MSKQDTSREAADRNHNASLPPAGDRGLGSALPALLTLGGGLAALWLLENQTGAVSRTTQRAREAAEDWLHDAEDLSADAGRRARQWAHGTRRHASERAGEWGDRLTEILNSGASQAAKLGALKKLGEYATSAARSFRETARPGLHAVRERARHAGEEGSERFHGAYSALRGRPFRRHDERDWGFGDAALIGVALAGAGLAATFLLSPESGAQRRRALRLRTQALGRQAGEWAQDVAETARRWSGATEGGDEGPDVARRPAGGGKTGKGG